MAKYKVSDRIIMNQPLRGGGGLVHVEKGRKGIITAIQSDTTDEYQAIYEVQIDGESKLHLVYEYKFDLIEMERKFNLRDRIALTQSYDILNAGTKGTITEIVNGSQPYVVYFETFGIKLNCEETILEKIYEVEAAFIKEAHKAACFTWQRRLEDRFSDLFVNEDILWLLNKFNRPIVYEEAGIKREAMYKMSMEAVRVDLPYSNNDWTFEAWKWIFAFCEFAKQHNKELCIRNEHRHVLILLSGTEPDAIEF